MLAVSDVAPVQAPTIAEICAPAPLLFPQQRGRLGRAAFT